jgi:hypothetical protein
VGGTLIYTYSIALDTPNQKVATDSLTVEINVSSIITAIDYISVIGDDIKVAFKASLSTTDKTTLDGLINVHQGEHITAIDHVEAEDYPISKNTTPDGKVLYAKIHGQKSNVSAGANHRFQLTIPYTEAYFQGAEIIEDIIGVSDFTIRSPDQVAADDFSDPDPANHIYGGHIEQYGYSVNMGVIKYIREAKYAARLPQGLVVECNVTNDTAETKEIGVNFILHDIRTE